MGDDYFQRQRMVTALTGFYSDAEKLFIDDDTFDSEARSRMCSKKVSMHFHMDADKADSLRDPEYETTEEAIKHMADVHFMNGRYRLDFLEFSEGTAVGNGKRLYVCDIGIVDTEAPEDVCDGCPKKSPEDFFRYRIGKFTEDLAQLVRSYSAGLTNMRDPVFRQQAMQLANEIYTLGEKAEGDLRELNIDSNIMDLTANIAEKVREVEYSEWGVTSEWVKSLTDEIEQVKPNIPEGEDRSGDCF